jgi:hypothetical protein
MSSKQLTLAGLGLAAVVAVAFFVFSGPTEDAKVEQTPGLHSNAGERQGALQGRQPGSLSLSGSAASSSSDKSPNREADHPMNRSKGEVGETVQERRPRLAQVNRGHGDGGDLAPDADVPAVQSQTEDAAPLAGEVREAVREGAAAGAARAPVDDWPADAAQVGNQAEAREPEEGEVLTLFEGDAIASQAEASIEKGVEFDEEGANFKLDSEYAVPMAGRLKGDSGTISFWVRPDGETSDTDNASLVQLRSRYEWENRLQIWKDGGNVRMVFADGTGAESGATYGSNAWAPDEWRLVTATWGEGTTALYVNGQLAGTSQYQGGFTIRPNTVLHVGSNYSDDPRSLTGAVNQFRVYDRALGPDEVTKLSSQYPD